LAEQFAMIFHQGTSCETIAETLRALGIQVDYVEEHDNRRFAAVIVEGIRLIDNYQRQQHHC
jgi:pantoate--beta-alanine ligase